MKLFLINSIMCLVFASAAIAEEQTRVDTDTYELDSTPVMSEPFQASVGEVEESISYSQAEHPRLAEQKLAFLAERRELENSIHAASNNDEVLVLENQFQELVKSQILQEKVLLRDLATERGDLEYASKLQLAIDSQNAVNRMPNNTEAILSPQHKENLENAKEVK
jgi:hypothetical protein